MHTYTRRSGTCPLPFSQVHLVNDDLSSPRLCCERFRLTVVFAHLIELFRAVLGYFGTITGMDDDNKNVELKMQSL